MEQQIKIEKAKVLEQVRQKKRIIFLFINENFIFKLGKIERT